MKYLLNYSDFGPSETRDAQIIEFSTSLKRANFIADKTIGFDQRKVFTLTVYYDKEMTEFDIYIFHSFRCIQDVVKTKWHLMELFEWDDYEDAVKFMLDLRELTELSKIASQLN